MSRTINTTDAALVAGQLGTETHPLNKGDSAEIKNTTFGGNVITEGWAKIVEATDTNDRYVVEFSDGTKVERFVSNNPENIVLSVLKRLIIAIEKLDKARSNFNRDIDSGRERKSEAALIRSEREYKQALTSAKARI